MKTALLAIFIYLSGSVLGYHMGKKKLIEWNVRYDIKIKYSVADRNYCLIMSVFSWFDVAALGIIYATDDDMKNISAE